MTTLSDRPETALVVIDVQKGVVAEAHQRDAVVANISTLVDKAREEGVPIIWVQHSDGQLVKGSDDWEIRPRVGPPGVRATCAQDVRGLLRGHRP
jgi:nicotinamidase-related amidase